MRLFIGIDPGARGGLVALTEKGDTFLSTALTGVKSLVGVLKALASNDALAPRVAVEDIGAIGLISTWARKSVFGMGRAAGHVEALIEWLGWSWTYVKPKDWQKAVTRPTDGDNPKARAKMAFARRWPMAKCNHDGVVDAALIAEWARTRGGSA